MTDHPRDRAAAVAARVAGALASPEQARRFGNPQGWWPQSLAYGAAGTALLHIERAHTGNGPWSRAHDWLARAAEETITAGPASHLYYGAPAVAFALHATTEHTNRYGKALDSLDRQIHRGTSRRLDQAHERIDGGNPPALSEFDAIRGMTGIGAYLLRRHPDADLLRSLLAYLVRLTDPLVLGDQALPGWWTAAGPSGTPSPLYPGGHGNNGVAHGITGPLALLALAARQGVDVDGQTDALSRICAWLDRWQHDTPDGPRWPYWITRAQLQTEAPIRPGTARPSWCYGTAGLARAQQLAAIALGDTTRQAAAEHALGDALTDQQQLAAVADLSLCHGHTGLLHIARRVADDAATPRPAATLAGLLDAVVPEGLDPQDLAMTLLDPVAGDIGLLEGAAGVALALHAAATDTTPISRWDSCLLIN
jgi:lantibiotic biosynthesis protein